MTDPENAESINTSVLLFSADLDGTLIDSETIDPKMIRALSKLKDPILEGRVKLLFNTARFVPLALSIVRQVYLALAPASLYLATDLGGRLSEVSFDDYPITIDASVQDIQHTPLTPDELRQIVYKAISPRSILNFYSSVDHRIHTFTDEEHMDDSDRQKYVRASFIELFSLDNLERLEEQLRFLQPSMVNIERVVREEGISYLHIAEYLKETKVSITPYGITKASGIEKLLRYLELQHPYIIAAGDQQPDQEAFRIANQVIVVGNNIPKVRHPNSHVLDTPSHFADVFDKIVSDALQSLRT